MIGIIIITVLSLIFSLILTNLESSVNENSRIEKLKELLPGYNCGACGFNSCENMAHKIEENPANYEKCKPLRKEAKREMEAYLKLEGMLKD